MDPKQEELYQYILDRVEGKNIEHAKALLTKTFEKQDEDSFTKCDLTVLTPLLMSIVKPESIKEVQDFVKTYGQGF